MKGFGGGLVDLSVNEATGVARVVLNNASKRNVLSRPMILALSETIRAVRQPKVRFVTLEADGHVFSSGHDLKELKSMDSQKQVELFRDCGHLMRSIQTLPVPVMALLDGLAAAAGLQLLSACDMAVATEASTFQLPGVRFGLFCSTPAVYAYRSAPHSKMLMHMLCTGNPIHAAEALRIGLVSHVFPKPDEMRQFAQETAEQVRALPASVIAMGKSAFLRQAQMQSTGAAYDFAADVMVDNLGLPECQAGLEAFAAKKKPQWD